MTREEKINLLNELLIIEAKNDIGNLTSTNRREFQQWVKVLEQEPCDDVVSRQAARKALEDRFMELQKRHSVNRYETNFCLNTILELPPVTPQQKMGYWVDTGSGQMYSRCGEIQYGYDSFRRFCASCGCKMVKPPESEVEE